MDARWQRTGALLGVVRSLEEAIELDRRGEGWFLPYNVVVRLLALGSLYEILEPDRALWCFTQLEAVAHHNPLDALRGAIRKASLLGQIERLAELSDAAQAWNEPGTTALARSRWARALRQAGRAEDALQALEGVFDASAMPERALCLNALNRDVQALEMLEAAVVSSQRMDQLEAWAARYQITRDTADLEHLIHLTDARERVLPALVPLETLPKTRPELSAPYPLVAVLRSGWKAAIQHRHGDIPALEVRVLGGFEVRVLGEVVTLTARPKDILMLSALKLPREHIAEALWPDADTDKSRNNLHVNLNALRKVVEPWGVPTYILESGLARANVDLWDLDHALATHDLNTVKRLYADLAPGFDLEVIEDTRANLRERTLEAMLEYATQSDPRTAEDTLEWVLSHDPTHETAFSRLLGLLVRSGRRVSAERRYREFARRLRDELGLEPAPETHRILSAV